MKQNNHEDEKLIKLLRELPTLKDHRSINEIYSSINEEVNKVHKQKRKRSFVWPSIATALVLIFSVFLVSDNLNPNDELEQTNHREIAYDSSLNNNESKVPIERQEKSFSILKESDENNLYRTENSTLNAVYAKDLMDDDMVITIGIPDEHAMNIVPVSVVVKDSKKHWLDHYNEVFQEIDEEKLGLLDYYPYKGNLKMINSRVVLDLYHNHNYGVGSTSERLFLESLRFFEYQNINNIYLYEESKPGVFLSHTGEEIYEYALDDFEKRGYLIYKIGNHEYYVPSPNQSKTIEEAFKDMNQNNEIYQLEPSIPDHLYRIETNEMPGKLVVKFQGNPELADNLETLRMIEAILLTAEEYGFKEVQFENTNVNKIGPFNLDNPLDVPMAPNPVELKS